MKLLDDLYVSPTTLNAVENIKNRLLNEGYTELVFKDKQELKAGGKYFIIKNELAVVAFNIGSELNETSFNIVASHLDCPGLKLKPQPIVKTDGYVRLAVEQYGGAILYSWLDRPLSLAGRVMYQEENSIKSKVVNIDEDLLVIPSLAIHQNREVNKGVELKLSTDMLPVLGLKEDVDFKSYLTELTGINNIKDFDLYLYPRIKGTVWGKNKDLISSNHLDNLECAFTSLDAFVNATNNNHINVYAAFDNEEVGSNTAEGADSTILKDTLMMIAKSLDLDYLETLNNSFLVSADNAHAIHPAHPEKSDPGNHPYMNEGIVIKQSSSKSYTGDGLTASILESIFDSANVKHQRFNNNSDVRGGSTLGAIITSSVSILSADIGLATLAMHSSYETGGLNDVDEMVKGLTKFYSVKLKFKKGTYSFE